LAVTSKKFQTPETVPGSSIILALTVPNDPMFLAFLTGQIAELTFADNWVKFGALTPEQTAEIFEDVLISWLDEMPW
jgi:hypothetical protein